MTEINEKPKLNKDQDLILIVGGGPAGLGAALAFRNNDFKNIVVLEGRPDMNFNLEESYPIGVNVRGQTAIKSLFADSPNVPDVAKLGLRIDQWKILVGPSINVANFNSGLVVGTSRAAVTQLLYEETQRRGNIQVLFNSKAKDVDLKSKTVTCESSGEEKVFNPACLIVADGFRSKIRDALANADSTLKVQQWPWKDDFRVLISTPDVQTQLNPYVHYIENQIYTSKLLDGRWTSGVNIKENSPSILRSNSNTDQNVQELKKYVASKSLEASKLYTDEEYRQYFSRKIFSGAVTKVSKLVVDGWAVLIGDAAHSPFPATGEGINSALEDGAVLQNIIKNSNNNKSFSEILQDFEKERLPDANALSDMAYATINRNFKGFLQTITLKTFQSLKLAGPSKEDLLFGKYSGTIKRYSDVLKIWEKQTCLLGGPTVPKKMN